MARSLLAVVLIVIQALCVERTHATVDEHETSAAANDATEIYKKFLKEWTEEGKTIVNVAKMAQVPSSEDIGHFSSCVREDRAIGLTWLPAKPIDDLSKTVGKLPYVHLVDPKKWKPQDPEDLISQKQSIESAVEASFAHGLMTLSAITFDGSQRIAAFTYSFVCGSLCGNGATVVFRKTTGGWVQSKTQCGGWVS